jgi:hypothetical protein
MVTVLKACSVVTSWNIWPFTNGVPFCVGSTRLVILNPDAFAYLVITQKPDPRSLVVFIISDHDIVRSN